MSMKVAVSSAGTNLDSAIDPRFGRCANFLVVETEDMSFEAFDNDSIALGGGAGIQSAQFIASKGASAVLTGNCGPNAMRTLAAAGLKVFIGQAGTVREVVERFKTGRLSATPQANVDAHYGMGAGRGAGRCTGGGMGRGIGRGMGRGMGGNAPVPQPAITGSETTASPSNGEEIRALKKEAKEMLEKMQEIEKRIARLQGGG
jgi:predicted Fe-Mo cluster-binding NifX family protein